MRDFWERPKRRFLLTSQHVELAGKIAMKKKSKFTKAELKKIEALMRKYGVNKKEAAQMYVRSGL